MKKVKIKLTKAEMVNLYEGLKLMKSYAHSDLSLAKHRTLKFMQSEYEAIIELRNEAMAEGKDYDKEMHEYLITVCKTDMLGRPKINMNGNLIEYDFIEEKKDEIAIKAKEIEEKHKDSLNRRAESLDAYNKMIGDKTEKIDVVVCQIKYDSDAMNKLGIGNDMEYSYILFDEKTMFDESEEESVDSKKLEFGDFKEVKDSKH